MGKFTTVNSKQKFQTYNGKKPDCRIYIYRLENSEENITEYC